MKKMQCPICGSSLKERDTNLDITKDGIKMDSGLTHFRCSVGHSFYALPLEENEDSARELRLSRSN